MSSVTPNYGLVLQDIGENPDTWGIPLNENFSKIDAAMTPIQAFFRAVGFLPEVDVSALDNAPAINNAINFANLSGGGVVIIPPGQYNIRTRIILKQGVALVGHSMGISTIFVDDSVSPTTDYISNSPDGVNFPALTNVLLKDFTITGRGETVHTTAGQVIRIRFCENVRIIGVESRYSRNMGMVVTDCDQVTVTGCKVFRTIADGIAVWNSSNVLISNNILIDVNDDCISCHSDNADLSKPPPGGIVIIGNTVEGSQGIKVLGAKSVVVSNNVLRRMLSYGIVIFGNYGAAPVQGTTPMHSVLVENNVINDVIFRPEPSPRNVLCQYILIGGARMQRGSASSVPGWPTGSGNTITSFYTAQPGLPRPGYGAQYVNNPNTTNNFPSPGPSWLVVRGNICTRTLPATPAYSDWGYGPLWVGSNGDGSGFFNGTVSDASFQGVGLVIYPSVNNGIVEGNIFQIGAKNCIELFPNDIDFKNFDIWRMVIRNNKFVDYVGYAIIAMQSFGASISGVFLDMTIEGNEFDADPRFVHTNRGPNGTWLSFIAPNNKPLAVAVDDLAPSMTLRGNTFRNLCQPVGGGGLLPGPSSGNVVVGNFLVVNGHVSNAGVGTAPPGGGAFKCQFEDCNPTSANYGKRLSVSPISASAMPTTGYYGRGDFVSNSGALTVTANRVLAGWRRLTFGNTHVLNTDWVPVYDVTV